MRHLGIDFGTKKVGIALSDEGGSMGFPEAVLPNDEHLLRAITTLIQEREVGKVVMGESFDFSGQENPVGREARSFGDTLTKVSGVPVVYEMEILSTQEARRDLEGNRTNHGDVDASAAALILTSYLSKDHGND